MEISLKEVKKILSPENDESAHHKLSLIKDMLGKAKVTDKKDDDYDVVSLVGYDIIMMDNIVRTITESFYWDEGPVEPSNRIQMIIAQITFALGDMGEKLLEGKSVHVKMEYIPYEILIWFGSKDRRDAFISNFSKAVTAIKKYLPPPEEVSTRDRAKKIIELKLEFIMLMGIIDLEIKGEVSETRTIN